MSAAISALVMQLATVARDGRPFHNRSFREYWRYSRTNKLCTICLSVGELTPFLQFAFQIRMGSVMAYLAFADWQTSEPLREMSARRSASRTFPRHVNV